MKKTGPLIATLVISLGSVWFLSKMDDEQTTTPTPVMSQAISALLEISVPTKKILFEASQSGQDKIITELVSRFNNDIARSLTEKDHKNEWVLKLKTCSELSTNDFPDSFIKGCADTLSQLQK